jgi:hypothetical protein
LTGYLDFFTYNLCNISCSAYKDISFVPKSDNCFAEQYRHFVVVSSLLIMVETNIKLPRQEQWISSMCDMLITGTDFAYAAENITTRHMQLTPLVAKVLLHILVRDQSRSQNVASNVFKILAKRLIDFTKTLNILPTSKFYDPIATKSPLGKSPVFSPLGSSASLQLSFKGEDNTSIASSSEAIGPFFQIGDKVDGLVKLANGSQRWFPGSISAGDFHIKEIIHSLKNLSFKLKFKTK